MARQSMNALQLIAGLRIGDPVVMRVSERKILDIANELRQRGWAGPRSLRITEATDVKRLVGECGTGSSVWPSGLSARQLSQNIGNKLLTHLSFDDKLDRQTPPPTRRERNDTCRPDEIQDSKTGPGH